MPSMLEVLREYKHLTTKKKEGELSSAQETRLKELQAIVRANAPTPSGARSTSGIRGGLPRASSGVNRTPPPRGSSGSARATADIDSGSSPAADAEQPSPPPRATSVSRLPRGVSTADISLTADIGAGTRDIGATKTSALDGLLRNTRALWWFAVLMLVAGLAASLGFGLSVERVLSNLVPGLLLIGGIFWAAVYPGLIALKLRGISNTEEIVNNVADLDIKLPTYEPVIAILTLLVAVGWLMISGYAQEGIGPIVGYLFGMGFGLASIAVAAMLVVRRFGQVRLDQITFYRYKSAANQQFKAGKPRRTRKLIERALTLLPDELEREPLETMLRQATLKEAEVLRSKGLNSQAESLLRDSGTAKAAQGTIASLDSVGESIDLVEAKIYPVAEIKIAPPDAFADEDDAQKTRRQKANKLAHKGRNLHAFQMLLDAGQPVHEGLAREAAREYISQSVLRTADAIFEALGERQIPEFYKAVAAETAKSNEGNPDPEACMRLAKILVQLKEPKPAAQIACRGALTKSGEPQIRQHLARFALELCQQVNASPPAELLELMGEYSRAATAYKEDGRPEEAQRCLRESIDKLLANAAAPRVYAPLLSQMFLINDRMPDKYLKLLAQEVIRTGAKSGTAQRILVTARARDPDDTKVVRRLFELHVEANKVEDALTELTQLASMADSSSDVVLRDYQSLAKLRPDDIRIMSGIIRSQLKLGKTEEALVELRQLISAPAREQYPAELVELLEFVTEWKADAELKKELSLLKLATDSRDEALADLEKYVIEGGRDPQVIQHVEQTLRNDLVLDSGTPNYDAHLRLARFYLHRGSPGSSLDLLEVARASPDHAYEAELLIARAQLAGSNPRAAIAFLEAAIAGRGLSETPELHFELARALEETGELGRAQKIDETLELALPGFLKEYGKERVVFEQADTEWAPADFEGVVDGLVLDTDLNAKKGVSAGVPIIAAPVDNPIELTDALAPRYEIERKVGSGGMGDVFLARDLVLGRNVAIKVLRRTLATDLFLQKFKDEARIVAQLSHPGIVGVHDIGQRGDWAYIVMEFVDGANLAMLVSQGTPPTRPVLLRIMAEVSSAMAYAHSRSVIHRDLKPANILVARDGVAKVTDFGIAHVLQAESDETAFSAAGLQVGTVNYMAPEQIKGGKVDGRTDIYLLGTTLYYCLAYRYPFSGEGVVVRKVREDPDRIDHFVPGLSPELSALVMRCIAREPDARFEDMSDLQAALVRLPELHVETPTEFLTP